MTIGSNGDSGMAGKTKQIKEARMFASRLQHAINTGRSTLPKMREVDKMVSNRLTTQTAYVLQTINNLMRKTLDAGTKEKLNKIYLELLNLFNEFKLMESRGYGTMVRSRGIVNSSRLDELVDLDTELLSTIALLYRLTSKTSIRKSISVNKCKEILYMIDDMLVTLKRRYKLIEVVYKRRSKKEN